MSQYGTTQLPRQLGAETVGEVQQDLAAVEGFHAWFNSLKATTRPTVAHGRHDAMAIYVYVEGEDAIFVGADLISNPDSAQGASDE